MIRQDRLQRSTLRLLKSALDYIALKSGKDDLSDIEAIRVIQKEAKKRKEAHEQFLEGGRVEQAEQERQDLRILESYMPKPFTEEELRTAVQTVISEPVAMSKTRHGSSDSVCSVRPRRRLVGKAISQIVGNLLS